MRCRPDSFNVGKFDLLRDAIDIKPEYQRQAGAWGTEKQQLFLHSLFAGYDVPKIYLHELPRNGGKHRYALVDGKQRLQCIWDFLDGKIALGSDFHEFEPYELHHQEYTPFPKEGDHYRDLSPEWRKVFKAESLTVTIISELKNGDDDIEALFYRLNNGEALNAAEKRNAFGTPMCQTIRSLAPHKFFTTIFPKPNKRYLHYDLVARFLLIEDSVFNKNRGYCTPKKRFLDDLVRQSESMKKADITRLEKAVNKQLNSLCRVFNNKDPRLKKAGYPQLYYLFIKEMEATYADANLLSNISKFIDEFIRKRDDNLNRTPEGKSLLREREREESVFLDEFEHMMGQGNDSGSLKKRVKILSQFFLEKHPETKLRGKQRNFSDAERYIIFLRGDKKCAGCGKEFANYDDFEADHIVPWIASGDTSLSNAQALCINCNRTKGAKLPAAV